VGLAAAALSLRLTEGPVVTGGIDFSFSLDSYHARSSPGHREKLRALSRLTSILNADSGFRHGAAASVSKSGVPVRTDPSMRGYRDLFEREFSGEGRLYDTEGSGLPLGVKTLDAAGAFALLGGAETAGERGPAEADRGEKAGGTARRDTLGEFINDEIQSLLDLRGMLTGDTPADGDKLSELLDGLDYLWAHFPDCAGREGWRPPETDLSFLKRVRAEIDPFLRLWKRTAGEIQGN
jgi:hypothetical protein